MPHSRQTHYIWVCEEDMASDPISVFRTASSKRQGMSCKNDGINLLQKHMQNFIFLYFYDNIDIYNNNLFHFLKQEICK